MSAKIKELVDKDKTTIYPVTKASAVYMADTFLSIEDSLEEVVGSNMEIQFPSSTQIIKTLRSGNVVNTVFNADGSISEVVTNKEGKILQRKKTTFNADGSISIATESEE